MLCLWIGGLNILRMSILKFTCNSCQHEHFFSGATSRAEYKMLMEVQWVRENIGGLDLSDIEAL